VVNSPLDSQLHVACVDKPLSTVTSVLLKTAQWVQMTLSY